MYDSLFLFITIVHKKKILFQKRGGFMIKRLIVSLFILGLFDVRVNYAQDFENVEMTVHPVSGNVLYIAGRGGNIGLLHGEDGILLIDDQYAPLTEKIIKAVNSISSQPIRYIINTHMHPDHTGGNENFGRLGAMIVGHENVRSQMAKAGYSQTPPFVTFSQDVTFHVNQETVHVFKVPNAHTNNDSFIKFVSANTIHTGDVYRSESYPYIDINNGGSFLGTIAAYELLIEASDQNTKIIPGHGGVTNIQRVVKATRMLQVIRDRVQNLINDDLTLEGVLSRNVTQEYNAEWDSGRRIGGAVGLVTAAYRDLIE